MELASALKDGGRIAASTALVALARLDDRVRTRLEAALHWADLPTPADRRRLSERLRALHRAVDTLR